MDTLITLQQASRQYNISLPDLRQMARDGKIWSAKFNGEVVVAVSHDGELKVRDDGHDGQATQTTQFVGEMPVPIPAKDESLRGQPIRVTEAAERYGIC
ncbi:MAG: helix-turn-helix domain-containing protein, partial [Chloroflexi bacterium]|nr:helix-turn-helix domain-containing protein [Chloroflexota bacterium]